MIYTEYTWYTNKNNLLAYIQGYTAFIKNVDNYAVSLSIKYGTEFILIEAVDSVEKAKRMAHELCGWLGEQESYKTTQVSTDAQIRDIKRKLNRPCDG